MESDEFGLTLATASSSAAKAYREGCRLLLTLYPGAAAAFDRAIDADPGFALAHVGKARALQVEGDLAKAKAAFALAESLAVSAPPRDASHIAIFGLLLSGQPAVAFDAVRGHLAQWPRDVMVLSTSCSQTGLIALSGRAGRDWALAEFLDELAPHYDGHWWFDAHHGMALSETGRQQAAWTKIQRSLDGNPRNGTVAHVFAHYAYENGDHEGSRRYLRGWLQDYPRKGLLRGHLSWHLAICELESGDHPAGLALYDADFGAEDFFGPALFKIMDSTSYLWRSELAGHPRDDRRWRAIRGYAYETTPHPGLPYVDWHIALADAVVGEPEARAARIVRLNELVSQGRYAAEGLSLAVNEAAAAFVRQDFPTAIAALTPLLPVRERLGGSLAQLDLLDFTLMKALDKIGRADDLAALVAARRQGPRGIPVLFD